eukprot:CAMPEP_0178445412 /NCGR_PEP_ID=MMETSP0689_2-20121128/40141_1 /TAXON_ID=160604 /ORGANISM="Amphidinium massartii, Strain CS-259" /LENGTH=134 /DNA_ID=CAMNT_0020069937 /DNA_START=131 /DNA_END=535 /DNA_ORIENTATION=+
MDAEVRALAAKSKSSSAPPSWEGTTKQASFVPSILKEVPPRPAGSVFSSGKASDCALRERVYGMDLFGPAAQSCGGVEDDMTGLQLRIASRLHSRWTALTGLALEETWRLQREEMAQADRFLSSFDAAQSRPER